jgi:hypothetical protein
MRAVEIFILILVVLLIAIIAKPLVEWALTPQVVEISCGDLMISEITLKEDPIRGVYIYEATASKEGGWSSTKIYLSSWMQESLKKSGNRINDCIVGSPVFIKEQPAFPVLSRDTPGPPFSKVGERQKI